MKTRARILIAGCGYVGCAAAARLRDRGHEVFGARRNIAALADGVRPVAIDLLQGDLESLPSNLDAIVWALSATRSPEGYAAAYEHAPRRLLQFLHERGDELARAVLVSSSSVWHRDDGAFVDESTEPNPRDFRGEAVLAGETAFAASPFPTTILRLTGIYGPGRTRLIDGIANGSLAPPAKETFGNRIHRDDAAKAIEHVLHLEQPAPIYTVVDDDPADLRDVYAFLAEQLGTTLPAPTQDFPARSGNKRCRNDLLRASGWQPDVPDYRSGYAAMLNER